MVGLTEPIFEKAVHAWLEGHVYALFHGLQIAPAEPDAPRVDPHNRHVLLEGRLRQARVRRRLGKDTGATEEVP